MSDAGTRPSATALRSDEEILAARLARLAAATTEDEIRAVEGELLAETENGTHEGEEELENQS